MQRLDRLTAGDKLYFLSLGLFLVISLLSNSFFYRFFEGKACMLLQIFCMLLLAGYEYRNGFLRAQQWAAGIVLAGLTALSMWSALGSMTRMVPMMFPYIYCARRISFEKIARFSLKWSIITVALIVFSGYLGLIDNVVMYKSGRIREFLGFRYALYLPGFLLNITLLWIYVRGDKLRIWEALLFGVINWVAYYQTDSRTSFVIAEGMLAVGLLMKWLPKITDKLRWLWACLIPVFAISGLGSVLMTVFYDGKVAWMRRLNNSLSGRLNLGQRSLEHYGVELLGQKIEWVGNGLDSAGNSVEASYDYVDCLYVKILQRYGVLFWVVLLILLTWAMYCLWKRREYYILLVSTTVALHCVLDDLSFALHFNTFWIAMGLAVIAPKMLQRGGGALVTEKKPPKSP